MRMVFWGALVAAASVLAFLLLDPIVAAFQAILLVTCAVLALLARARKRAEKWERGKDARARDRARWEAHQARQAGRTEQ